MFAVLGTVRSSVHMLTKTDLVESGLLAHTCPSALSADRRTVSLDYTENPPPLTQTQRDPVSKKETKKVGEREVVSLKLKMHESTVFKDWAT